MRSNGRRTVLGVENSFRPSATLSGVSGLSAGTGISASRPSGGWSDGAAVRTRATAGRASTAAVDLGQDMPVVMIGAWRLHEGPAGAVLDSRGAGLDCTNGGSRGRGRFGRVTNFLGPDCQRGALRGAESVRELTNPGCWSVEPLPVARPHCADTLTFDRTPPCRAFPGHR